MHSQYDNAPVRISVDRTWLDDITDRLARAEFLQCVTIEELKTASEVGWRWMNATINDLSEANLAVPMPEILQTIDALIALLEEPIDA